MKAVEINFAEYAETMKRGSGGRSLLLKAVGLTKNSGLRILDATAGLMRDAFFMAKFGGDVTAIERSPVLAEMIAKALIEFRGPVAMHPTPDSTAKNDSQSPCAFGGPAPRHPSYSISLDFIPGNAIELLPTLPPFDVIYLDPMFHEEKSAKAKKDLQFLQALHANEIDDSEELFKIARKHAKRVVIKRSLHAPFLGGVKPDWSYPGKSVRFDVYAANNFLDQS